MFSSIVEGIIVFLVCSSLLLLLLYVLRCMHKEEKEELLLKRQNLELRNKLAEKMSIMMEKMKDV